MKKLLCNLLAFLIALQPMTVHAWSEGGHHIISLMAFDLLSPEEQAKFLEILAQHPRYLDDFVPPKGLPNQEEERRWKVGRVGYWPDVARRQPIYHRASWHYELGPVIKIGNVQAPTPPGALPMDATLDSKGLHIAQAIELCRLTLKHPGSDEDKAIALCWMTHLVADAHQPCHAGSLYMEGVFEEDDGDRGANRILTKQRGNLHSLWDQLLGAKFSLGGTSKRIVEITTDSELAAFGNAAVSRLDPQAWLEESRSIAVESVYTPEILSKLELVSRGMVSEPEVVELSEPYLKNAGRIAQRRAIEAAYRLAEEYRQIL